MHKNISEFFYHTNNPSNVLILTENGLNNPCKTTFKFCFNRTCVCMKCIRKYTTVTEYIDMISNKME